MFVISLVGEYAFRAGTLVLWLPRLPMALSRATERLREVLSCAEVERLAQGAAGATDTGQHPGGNRYS